MPLARAVAGMAAFTASFAHTGWFALHVRWLAPDPGDPLRRLTAAVAAAFPQHPPDEGAYEDVVHTSPSATTRRSSRCGPPARQVRTALPVRTRVSEVHFVGRPEVGGQWDVGAGSRWPERHRRRPDTPTASRFLGVVAGRSGRRRRTADGAARHADGVLRPA